MHLQDENLAWAHLYFCYGARGYAYDASDPQLAVIERV
jgi:hypothetical protein